MLVDIFILLSSGIVLLFPLLVWLFVFVNFGIPRKYFFVWIILWAILSIILWKYSQILEPIFRGLYTIWESFFGVDLFFLLGVLFFIPSLVTLSIASFKPPYLKIIFWIVWIILFLSIAVYYSVTTLQSLSPEAISFSTFVFSSVGWIIWYYIIIALLEEGIKFFWAVNIQSLSQNTQLTRFILFWVIVSLGFALSENFLYTYFYYSENNVSIDLLQLSFFRSVFALSLHISAGILFVYGASYILLHHNKNIWVSLVCMILYILFSIWIHAFYDVNLIFGNSFVLLAALIMMYFLVSFLVFRKEIEL